MLSFMRIQSLTVPSVRAQTNQRFRHGSRQALEQAGSHGRIFAKISVESFYQSAFKLATRDGILTRSHVAFLPMWVCFNRFHSIIVADKKKNDAQRYQLQEEVNCPAKCARSMMQHSEMHHSV